MSTPQETDPLTVQVQAIRNQARYELEVARDQLALARSSLGTPTLAAQTQEDLTRVARNIHAAKVFTATEIAEILHLSRSRVYQILAPATFTVRAPEDTSPPPPPPAPSPAETRLPETDV
jgi:hypothetical protein